MAQKWSLYFFVTVIEATPCCITDRPSEFFGSPIVVSGHNSFIILLLTAIAIVLSHRRPGLAFSCCDHESPQVFPWILCGHRPEHFTPSDCTEIVVLGPICSAASYLGVGEKWVRVYVISYIYPAICDLNGSCQLLEGGLYMPEILSPSDNPS